MYTYTTRHHLPYGCLLVDFTIQSLSLPPSLPPSLPLSLSLSLSLDIVFTTAHSAKGLEFHTVKVANDYISEAYSGPVQNEFRPSKEF